MKPGIRYVTMLAARINRNPARMYFAALLPLCRNLIMDGKLQKHYGGQLIVYYKWVCRLTKLYPLGDGQSCRCEHHIWRIPKKRKSPECADTKVRGNRLLYATGRLFQCYTFYLR